MRKFVPDVTYRRILALIHGQMHDETILKITDLLEHIKRTYPGNYPPSRSVDEDLFETLPKPDIVIDITDSDRGVR